MQAGILHYARDNKMHAVPCSPESCGRLWLERDVWRERMRTVIYAMAGILAVAGSIPCARSQTAASTPYPSKPVRVVTIGPGGTVDFGARLLSQALSGLLNQQLVVDARPSGVIPGEIVAKAPADGYTILFAGGTLWQTPLVQ